MKKDIEQIFKIFNNILSRMENEEEDVKLHSGENYSSLQIRHFWFYYISYLYIIIFTACVWIFKSKISLISPTSIYMYILLFLSIIAVILYIYIYIYTSSPTILTRDFLKVLSSGQGMNALLTLNNYQERLVKALCLTSMVTGISIEDIQKTFSAKSSIFKKIKDAMDFTNAKFDCFIKFILFLIFGSTAFVNTNSIILPILETMFSNENRSMILALIIYLLLFVFAAYITCAAFHNALSVTAKINEGLKCWQLTKINREDFSGEKMKELLNKINQYTSNNECTDKDSLKTEQLKNQMITIENPKYLIITNQEIKSILDCINTKEEQTTNVDNETAKSDTETTANEIKATTDSDTPPQTDNK